MNLPAPRLATTSTRGPTWSESSPSGRTPSYSATDRHCASTSVRPSTLAAATWRGTTSGTPTWPRSPTAPGRAAGRGSGPQASVRVPPGRPPDGTPSGGRPPSTTTIRAPTTSRPGSSRRATTRRWGAVKESHKAEQRVGRADPSAARAVDVTVEGRVATVEMHLTWDAIEEVAGGPHPRRPARHLARVRQSRRGPADDSPRRGRPGPDRLAGVEGPGRRRTDRSRPPRTSATA